MLCSEASMVNRGLDGIQAVTLRCRAWTCELCAESRRKQLIALARSGSPTTFITLTVNPSELDGPHSRARSLADAWRKIIRLLARRCRKCQKASQARSPAARSEEEFRGRTLPNGKRCCYGYRKLAYFCVFEATKNGEPHLHILARVGWISQKWLSDKMKKLINAPVVDIRRVKNKKKLAYYVSKYCGKEPHRFTTCKRYWTTQNWELTKFEPEPPRGRWHKEWDLVRTPLSELAAQWESEGYEVTRSRHRCLAWCQGPPDEELDAYDEIMRLRAKDLPW